MMSTSQVSNPALRRQRGVSSVDGSTKAKIERAALTLFAQNGIDGVSTKQIAQGADISEGAIYRHFPGKEALAQELMLAIHNRLTDMIEAARESQPDIRSRVSFLVRHYCSIADDDWLLFQYHILHLNHFHPLSEDEVHSPLGAATLILQDAMDAGEIPVSDPKLLAAMTLGIVLQSAQAKVFGFIEGPLASRTDVFTRKIFAVLGLEDV